MQRMENLQAGSEAAQTQYGALCYRISRSGGTKILLITSRDTGRWVLPKGWPIKNKTGAESALREAYEEAGVEGQISGDCLGYYGYSKVMGERSMPCMVAVFPVRIEKLRRRFPEAGQRRLKWFKPAAAAAVVDEAELAEMLARFDPAGLAG